ncbi:MAG: hypothetical protein ACXWUG_09840 [Polyangiales bacterium]
MRFDHTDAMLRRSVFLLPFVLLACSSSDSQATDADTEDADYGDGPVTYRPDDGPDTATEETTAETAVDATSETGETATDSASDAPATPSSARIHEVYSDRNLEGDAKEFVEISGPEGIALDALHLRVIKPDGSVAFDLAVADAGAKMPASGFWVVGGSAASTNKSYSISAPDNWGLPNDSGAIQLTRNDGAIVELVDVVAYGTAPATPTGEPKAVVEGVPAALPAAGSTGKTFGRKSVPGDTNDNGTDFCVMNATPKAANGACL